MFCAGLNYTENPEIRLKYIPYLPLFSLNSVLKMLNNTHLLCNVAPSFYETIHFCHTTNCFALNACSTTELSAVKVFPKAFSAIRLILNLAYAMIIVMVLLLEGSLRLIT